MFRSTSTYASKPATISAGDLRKPATFWTVGLGYRDFDENLIGYDPQVLDPIPNSDAQVQSLFSDLRSFSV